MSANTVSILGTDVQVVEYKGERVVTLAQIDALHGRAKDAAYKQFARHEKRYVEGIDFHALDNEGTSEFRKCLPGGIVGDGATKLSLFTERGYGKIVRAWNDDRAWALHDEMQDAYFLVKRIASNPEALRPLVEEMTREMTREVLPQLVERALLEGNAGVTREFVFVLDLLKEKGVPPKGRRALSQLVCRKLIRFSADRGYPLRTSRETGRYMFHVDAVNAWLKQEGEGLIARHIADVKGQGHLFSIVPKKDEPE
ncbi:ORF6N domain-containing protein [Xanthobacter sediminis]